MLTPAGDQSRATTAVAENRRFAASVDDPETGYALTGVRESCYESGMNEFLTKPVSLDTLRDTLTRSLVARAESWCAGKVVSALEGGYVPDRVADACITHLRALA